ncbi:cobalamin-dependent protein [Paenibacillus pasadenensis]|uniref:cobalamin B12-binding domain-containing protein n=1 Tax=Paenibacillus pasadenensis TaxID=217090 RepID=UPI00203D920B|nr:cobalamin-dependent protein [Paenibacillus pasadenensis]MCM3747666.1 cobalamin-dependent protein [Paenibacillus pasadenensis]
MSIDVAVVGKLILDQEDRIAEEITRLQYERQPELSARFGEIGWIKTKQDTLYSLKYLAESIHLGSPLLFSSYMTWLRVLLQQYRVSTEDIYVNILCFQEVLMAELGSEYYETAEPHLEAALRQLSSDEVRQHSHFQDSSMVDEVTAYTELLLEGRRAEASQLIMDLVDRGTPLQTIYLDIFQQSQYEIGRLWQTGRITVAQEHYCSAATQLIMSQLFPYLFTHSRKGRKLVSACVGGELHEIGLRMVTDIFELNGWDTYYVGANVPVGPLIAMLKEYKADVLAISCTMTYHVGLVRDLIADVRKDPECDNIRIVVGGFPFNIDRELWRSIGADGYGSNAEESVKVATELVRTDGR